MASSAAEGGLPSAAAVAARMQWRLAWRDGRFRGFAFVVLLLALVSLASAWAAAQRDAAAIEQLTAADARLWHAQGETNPHSAAHFGRYVMKPQAPLGFFDPGATAELGRVARLEAHIQAPPRDRPSEGGTAITRFGAMSAAFALQTLVPLMVILAGFTLFSGEHARTLLRQELAGGASGTSLAAGRLLGFTAAVLAVAAVPLIATVAVSALQGEAGEALRAGAAALGYGLYLVAWCGLTVAVSARFGASRSALGILLGLWIVMVLLVPRLAGDFAERLHPTPTAAAFQTAIRDELARGPSGHDTKDARLAAFQAQTLSRYGVSRIEDLPVNWDGLSLWYGEKLSAEVADRRFGSLWQSYEAQQAVRRWLAPLSPLIPLRHWSAALAGTDAAAHVAFTRSVEAYRYAFVQRLNLDIAANAPRDQGFDYKAPAALLATFAPFHYKAPLLRDDLRRGAPDLLLLAAWAILSVLLALRAGQSLRAA